jgi:hypothetical protein
MLKILEEQYQILTTWTPLTAVPPFNVTTAAGNPGHWNFLSTNQSKGGRKERQPLILKGKPDIAMLDEFLRSRKTEKGETLLDLFSGRGPGSDGWGKYKFRQYDEESLPDKSDGPFAYECHGEHPRWVTHYHGMKMEALYSILAGIEEQQGGLKASGDRESGHRYNESRGSEKKGVYFHTEGLKKKAMSYAHFVPLFGDGCYVQACLECTVDMSTTASSISTPTRSFRCPTANARPTELSTKEDLVSTTGTFG